MGVVVSATVHTIATSLNSLDSVRPHLVDKAAVSDPWFVAACVDAVRERCVQQTAPAHDPHAPGSGAGKTGK